MRFFANDHYWAALNTFTGKVLLSAYMSSTHATGSPKNVNFMIAVLQTMARHLEGLTGVTKVNKSSTELAELSVPAGYDLKNTTKYVVSPSDSTIEEHHTFDHPSEIFRASQSKNMLVDYLSVGLYSPDQDTAGLKLLPSTRYTGRCILEASKYSTKINNQQFFNTYNISQDSGPAFPADNFSNSGYSFLTPSVIRASDPTSAPGMTNTYMYSAFSGNGAVLINSAVNGNINPTTITSADYSNNDTHDRVLLSIFRNGIGDKEYEDTQAITPILSYAVDSSKTFVKREMYKNLFSNLGLTLHKRSTYDEFFDRPPGAVSETPTDIPEPTDSQYHELFGDKDNPHGLGMEHYSDGKSRTDIYYRNFMLNNPHTHFDDCLKSRYKFKNLSDKNTSNSVSDVELPGIPLNLMPTTLMPNNFKMWMHVNFGSTTSPGGTVPKVRSEFRDAVTNSITADSSPSFAAFMFFNMNLTAKIEVYRAPDNSTPLKEDTGRWSLLTKADISTLENSVDAGNSVLFCKISYYDEDLVKGLDLAIADKYFYLTKA